MCEDALIVEIVKRIAVSINEISEWTMAIDSADDFNSSAEGMIRLNAVCMKLMAIGEDVKSLDKRTDKLLLGKYPSIPWKNVMGLRDIIAHHYFDVDADEIYAIITTDLPPLAEAIEQIKSEATQKWKTS